MGRVRAIRGRGKARKVEVVTAERVENGLYRLPSGEEVSVERELLGWVLPLALEAWHERLQAEVVELCGPRGKHDGGVMRWGTERGSICLGKQKVAVRRPRLRDCDAGCEVPIETYRRYQDPALFDEHVYQEGLKRVSQRDYQKGAEELACAFGMSKSTVSRGWIRATEKALHDLQERDLTTLNTVAVFIDGKRFQTHGVMVALGVCEDGSKYVLGVYQADSESKAACLELLNSLERRGLPEEGILFVVDGGKGLNAALDAKYKVSDVEKRRALRIRCYQHKKRNLEDILGRDTKAAQNASHFMEVIRLSESKTDAIRASAELEKLLKRENLSALASYQEAKDDLLILHDLKLTPRLQRFFSTTNPIESLNSLLEEDLRRNKRWRDSAHFQRWVANAALHNEKRMRRIQGFRDLKGLRSRILGLCGNKNIDPKRLAA